MTKTPDVDEGNFDDAERLRANSEVHASAWQESLEEMWALEEELQEEGWDTLVTAAGHTGPVAPSHDYGYWGLTHIVPDSDAEAIGELVDGGEFPSYDVYRSEVNGRVFGVTVLLDPDSSTAILITNQFELRLAGELVAHTHEVGHVNTIVRYLDGTVVAEIRHEEPGKFFPRYESFETYTRHESDPASGGQGRK